MPKMRERAFLFTCTYLLSVDDRVRKVYAMGRLVPFGMMCEMTALIPYCNASPAIINGRFGSEQEQS